MRKSEVFQRGAVLRRSGDRPLQERHGVPCPTAYQAADAEQVQRFRVARGTPQYLLAEKLRSGNVSLLQTLLGLLEFMNGRH